MLLVAILAALGAGIPLLVRARRRRGWRAELAAAEDETAWLSRELVPDLRRTASAAGAAGGWAVSSGRVVALEDRLTGLEAVAPDDVARERARALRDAVRTARARLDQLSVREDGTDSLLLLDEVAADLEAVLRPRDQAGSEAP